MLPAHQAGEDELADPHHDDADAALLDQLLQLPVDAAAGETAFPVQAIELPTYAPLGSTLSDVSIMSAAGAARSAAVATN